MSLCASSRLGAQTRCPQVEDRINSSERYLRKLIYQISLLVAIRVVPNLRVAYDTVTWIRAMETLEAHALICVVAVSLKLCRGANTDNLAISYRNTVYQQFVLSPSSGGFSLPNEAMRVLEDTLQEFSQRLSAPQKARVWHALARIKSISDPIGCMMHTKLLTFR